jgi:hypothetical protein
VSLGDRRAFGRPDGSDVLPAAQRERRGLSTVDLEECPRRRLAAARAERQ